MIIINIIKFNKYNINYYIVELYHIVFYNHNHYDNSNSIINYVYLYILYTFICQVVRFVM